jgi:nicotinate-nucleotide--dimethylbenzimidazole phosphoribosyltransferase
MGKEPLLSLGMRLGEGTGAALAAGIVKAAVATHAGMATFAEAGVAGKESA